MTPGEEYRQSATELRAKARDEESTQLRAEWEHLARCYIALAKHADHDAMARFISTVM